MMWEPIIIKTLVCAAIGYATNKIALWSLFNPREPSIGNLFHGIIPARRGEIAAKIGEKVATDILTPDSVAQRLEDKALNRDTAELIANELTKKLEEDLPSLSEMFCKETTEQLKTKLVNLLVDNKKSISQFLSAGTLKDELETRINDLLARSLEDLVPRDDLHNRLVACVNTLFNGPDLATTIEGLIEKAKNHKSSKQALRVRDLLTEDLIIQISMFPEEYTPVILARLRDEVTGRDIDTFKSTLKKKALGLLDGELEHHPKLKALHNFWPNVLTGIIDDLVDRNYEAILKFFDDPELSNKVCCRLNELMDDFLDSSAGSVITALVGLIPEGGNNRLVEIFKKLGENVHVKKLISDQVEFLENKIWQIKLGSLFPFSADQVVTKTISMIDKQIQSEQFDLIVNDIVDGAMKHKIGRLSFLINRDETLIFCGMATRQWLFPMVSDNRGKILEKLAVDKMAEEQINSLKLDDLEKMIKDVVSNEFKVINMLGGVLGGLIGFVTEILSAMQL